MRRGSVAATPAEQQVRETGDFLLELLGLIGWRTTSRRGRGTVALRATYTMPEGLRLVAEASASTKAEAVSVLFEQACLLRMAARRSTSHDAAAA